MYAGSVILAGSSRLNARHYYVINSISSKKQPQTLNNNIYISQNACYDLKTYAIYMALLQANQSEPVSYTHLDVYKRQTHLFTLTMVCQTGVINILSLNILITTTNTYTSYKFLVSINLLMLTYFIIYYLL